MPSMQEWSKHVIHLECVTSSYNFGEVEAYIRSVRVRFQAGELSPEDYYAEMLSGRNDIRFHGTAELLEHDGLYYLVTARHVLYDK